MGHGLRSSVHGPSESDRNPFSACAQLRATPGRETHAGQTNRFARHAIARSATERLGAQGKLLLQGDRATLTLTGVDPEALRTWLSEARSGARARPVDAQLQRGAAGYSGTLSLTLGAAP